MSTFFFLVSRVLVFAFLCFTYFRSMTNQTLSIFQFTAILFTIFPLVTLWLATSRAFHICMLSERRDIKTEHRLWELGRVWQRIWIDKQCIEYFWCLPFHIYYIELFLFLPWSILVQKRLLCNERKRYELSQLFFQRNWCPRGVYNETFMCLRSSAAESFWIPISLVH